MKPSRRTRSLKAGREERGSAVRHEPGITPRANSPAHENGHRQPVTQARFEELLQELTDKFGGATSFVRAPGLGLWDSGRDVERDNIAVIEVMTLVRESLATAPR